MNMFLVFSLKDKAKIEIYMIIEFMCGSGILTTLVLVYHLINVPVDCSELMNINLVGSMALFAISQRKRRLLVLFGD